MARMIAPTSFTTPRTGSGSGDGYGSGSGSGSGCGSGSGYGYGYGDGSGGDGSGYGPGSGDGPAPATAPAGSVEVLTRRREMRKKAPVTNLEAEIADEVLLLLRDMENQARAVAECKNADERMGMAQLMAARARFGAAEGAVWERLGKLKTLSDQRVMLGGTSF